MIGVEIENAKWYSVHFSEDDNWQIRTAPISGHPLGYCVATVEHQNVADSIVHLHNEALKRIGRIT